VGKFCNWIKPSVFPDCLRLTFAQGLSAKI
jgi:hypothetical protein